MEKQDNIICINNATVRFNVASEKIDNLKEYFIKLMKRQLYFEEFLALKNINLEIKKGESWGLIGRNGAGKSTLLKLICGILTPHQGSVTVNGSIAPLIELGAGLDSRLTAGENIFLNGALLGHSQEYMQEHFDEIVDFAELRNFLDMPIKNYSSGMRARLGFAIATTVCPDILIVDEVLAVGDASFRNKCQQRMEKMLEGGTTLLFVSHNEREVERLCKNTVWLDHGEIIMKGASLEVCKAYNEHLKQEAGTMLKKANLPESLDITHITIVGVGYVGLTTAAAFASKGYQVTCFDTDVTKINQLKEGKCPFYEPQLPELINDNRERLCFTSDPQIAYPNTNSIMLAVGTPETPEGSADLTYLYHALDDIVKYSVGNCKIIIKSTVPVGTNAQVRKYLMEKKRPDQEFGVISNPEFLSQGSAVQDMLYKSRIIVGAETNDDASYMRKLYKPFERAVLIVKSTSAEMIKYASNDFLALKISYINEIANLCEKTGANIKEVAEGMGGDPRIGYSFLNAGIGYGGSCFPKDTKALHWLASSNGYNIKTIQAAIDVNESQKIKLIEKAKQYYADFSGLTVAFLGVTFKPNTDDLREAPSLINAKILLDAGAHIQIWDPQGASKFNEYFNDRISVCPSIAEALLGADLCMIFTEWPEIKQMDLTLFEKNMKTAIVLDGRNCFVLSKAKQHAFIYESIGREIIGRILNEHDQ